MAIQPGEITLITLWDQLKEALAAIKDFVVEEKTDSWPRVLKLQRHAVKVAVSLTTKPLFIVTTDSVTAMKFGLKSVQPYKPRGRTGLFDVQMLAYRVASIFHRADEAEHQAERDKLQRESMSKAIEDLRPFPEGVIVWPKEGHYGFEYHHFRDISHVYEFLDVIPEKLDPKFCGRVVEVHRHAGSFGLKIDHGLTELQIREFINRMKS